MSSSDPGGPNAPDGGPPRTRSPRTLWRIARQRFHDSVQEQAAEKRRQLNALRDSIMGLVRAGVVVLDDWPSSVQARAARAAAAASAPAGVEEVIPITMCV